MIIDFLNHHFLESRDFREDGENIVHAIKHHIQALVSQLKI